MFQENLISSPAVQGTYVEVRSQPIGLLAEAKKSNFEMLMEQLQLELQP